MKTYKILYVSCHAVLEYDELRMFRDIGYPFFSIGAYINPESPHSSIRPPLKDCQSIPYALSDYHLMCQDNLKKGLPPDLHSKVFTEKFLNNFDVIIIMHIPKWIIDNWNVLKGRNVIWRTIGQSTPQTEEQLRKCREEGLRIVRYSPKERDISGYIGEDALIRFGKYEKDFNSWVGDVPRVITIGQHMKQRGWWCNYDIFKAATEGMARKLYGIGNADDSDMGGEELKDYDSLLDVLSRNAVYFYTGTRPASYTLNFIEAAMAGIPMVSIGPKSVVFKGGDYFEVSSLLEKYEAGFFSDEESQLRKYVNMLMSDRNVAERTSINCRKMSIELFDAEKIRENWRSIFDQL